MHISSYPNLKDLLLEIMSGRAIKEVGDFNIHRVKCIDQKNLADTYMADMCMEVKIDLQVHIKSNFEMPLSSIMDLKTIGSTLEFNVMNHLISEIEDNFLDEMQPILDNYWEEQNYEQE